jgi:hypothetical protein
LWPRLRGRKTPGAKLRDALLYSLKECFIALTGSGDGSVRWIGIDELFVLCATGEVLRASAQATEHGLKSGEGWSRASDNRRSMFVVKDIEVE